jgi:hypothetical protein
MNFFMAKTYRRPLPNLFMVADTCAASRKSSAELCAVTPYLVFDSDAWTNARRARRSRPNVLGSAGPVPKFLLGDRDTLADSDASKCQETPADTNRSNDPEFTVAVAKKVYYGPVYFRRVAEPYMTLATAGTLPDAGVSVAEVNLKLIWDAVTQMKVGKRGQAYVVDAQGRLIAHTETSLVLRNTDMTQLAQVWAARTASAGAGGEAKDILGRDVLTAYAPVRQPGLQPVGARGTLPHGAGRPGDPAAGRNESSRQGIRRRAGSKRSRRTHSLAFCRRRRRRQTCAARQSL